MNPENRNQSFERNTARALGHMSETNLPFAVEFLARRKNNGVRASSNYAFAWAMIRLDRHLTGRAFKEATPDDLARFMDKLRRGEDESTNNAAHTRVGRPRSASTMRGMCIHVGLIMREALGLEESKDIPRALRQAYHVARPANAVRGQVFAEKAFLAAIEAVPRLPHYDQTATYTTELVRALFWLMWDAGFRISELLSLRINDVAFDDATGTAKLQLREELAATHGLKTGARYVIIRDAVPALKTWLAIHPGRSDGESPIITSLAYYRNGVRGMNVDTVNRLIQEVFAMVDARPTGKRTNFSAHDFRHTAATRDAQQGYREPALRLKYGWSGSSPMPSHYVHLSEEDARQRVLATRPAGSAPALPAAVDLVNQLANQLARAMAALGREGAGAAPAIMTDGTPPAGAAAAQAA
ncbi:MAG: site-specific integrase [bacterium]